MRDINIINQQLANQREKNMRADEKFITADDIDKDVPVEKEEAVSTMLRLQEKR